MLKGLRDAALLGVHPVVLGGDAVENARQLLGVRLRRASRSVIRAAASDSSTPTMTMIHGRFSKNVPPSGPFGVTTSVNALSPNGTTRTPAGP